MKGESEVGFLTPPEVAKRWRVRADRIHTLIRAGRLKAFNVAAPGSVRPRFRIPVAAVAEFETSQQPTPPAPRTHAAKPQRPPKPPGWVSYVANARAKANS